MNPSHQTRRENSATSGTTGAPLAALAALLVAIAGCTDTPTKPDLPELTVTSDGFPVAQAKEGKGGGKPSGDGEDPSDFRPTMVRFSDGAEFAITSDAGIRPDLTSPDYSPDYVDGVCGVWANIGNFDDARFDPDRGYKKGKHARSCGAARAVVFNFPTGQRVAGTFFNIDGLDAIPSGKTEIKRAQFNICTALVFDSVSATRSLDGNTWTVTTDATDARPKARCASDSLDIDMPFSLTITTNLPLP